MTAKPTNGPVVVEIEDEAGGLPDPGAAPAVDTGEPPALIAPPPRRGRSRLGLFALSALGALASLLLGLAAWNGVVALMALHPVLGWAGYGLAGAGLAALLLLSLREWAALARLRRISRIRDGAERALRDRDLGAMRTVTGTLERLYAGRAELDWHLGRFRDARADAFDADALHAAVERLVLAPLDAAALREVEAAARQVAVVTAFVPLALADVASALWLNLRVIRRVAEVYGGRGGFWGAVRLARAVAVHLAATGAVAVGDDMLGAVAGGGVLSKLSRRFGEGLVNGALTARVGVAAIEVSRPRAFHATDRPRVSAVVGRALKGLFGASAR